MAGSFTDLFSNVPHEAILNRPPDRITESFLVGWRLDVLCCTEFRDPSAKDEVLDARCPNASPRPSTVQNIACSALTWVPKAPTVPARALYRMIHPYFANPFPAVRYARLWLAPLGQRALLSEGMRPRSSLWPRPDVRSKSFQGASKHRASVFLRWVRMLSQISLFVESFLSRRVFSARGCDTCRFVGFPS